MGAVKFDGRTKPLANSANTSDSTDAFPLPGANGGTLVDFTIGLGPSEGPAIGALVIFRGGSVDDAITVADSFVIRGSALTGAIPDAFVLDREVRYPGASTLRVYLRNDSGVAVGWTARWAAVVA